MRSLFILVITLYSFKSFGQDIALKLSQGYEHLLADSQLSHSIVAFYVVDSKSGTVLIDKNGTVGLAAASTQKVITSSTAFALLGHNYTYKTSLQYDGNLLNGDIILKGSGDPTFGSWRYTSTKEEVILKEVKDAFVKNGITNFKRKIVEFPLWKSETIPSGWTWEDIGSYYGAGAGSFIWRENQYDLIMKSGNHIGDTVQNFSTRPEKIVDLKIKMKVTAADKGTGDRSYIYLPSTDSNYYVRGSIPINENNFTISGSLLHPAKQFSFTLINELNKNNKKLNFNDHLKTQLPNKTIYTHFSPPLDSIIYWFLKKSINLYGEALLKTIAYEKTHLGETDSGISIIQNFWKDKGIDPLSINIKDGSGLSPANRITATALVTILQYDLKQPWFNSFFEALPEINKMKMKSGSISDVLAYTGYSKSLDGRKYTFAIIVNNYNGSSTIMREKMWSLLDILK